ncbi:MAG: hypothetical protein PHX87_05630 [Candidatus Peribacteraceae bacterium]|nr:hypothetical protein [Candidatus Peribacteraceae bacterium]MDD5742873.1 hypothetical protein [Candidatus Peribacteraceae bacterium]
MSDGRESDLPRSDESEQEGLAVEEVIRRISALQDPGSVRNVLAARERLNGTRIVPMEFPADATAEHPLLMEGIALYDENLVPDEAFRAMVEGEEARFRELIQRGGMLNRSRPNAAERPYYPQHKYESVHDQMHRDLTGQSQRPGRYRMMGLRSEKDALVAWMTYRLPPYVGSSAEDMAGYASYMHRIWKPVKLRGISRDQLPPFETLMEIDTINVRDGWQGGGTKLLAETLEHLRKTEGNDCPQNIYFYRFSRLSLRQPLIEASARQFSGGENTSSSQLFTSCGFDHIGHRQCENEIVAREVANTGTQNVVVLNPMWEYGMAQFQTAHELAERRLEKFYGQKE